MISTKRTIQGGVLSSGNFSTHWKNTLKTMETTLKTKPTLETMTPTWKA